MVSRPVHNLRRRVATHDHLVSVFRVACTCDAPFAVHFPVFVLPSVTTSLAPCVLVLTLSATSITIVRVYFGSCNGHSVIPSAGKIHVPFNWEYPRSLQLGISMVPSTGNIHDLFNWKISMIPSTGNIQDPFNWEYPWSLQLGISMISSTGNIHDLSTGNIHDPFRWKYCDPFWWDSLCPHELWYMIICYDMLGYVDPVFHQHVSQVFRSCSGGWMRMASSHPSPSGLVSPWSAYSSSGSFLSIHPCHQLQWSSNFLFVWE